jgi:(4S)-4-hydroxy-5-phosphonooxypentane-2,3-dione isomerase
MQEYTNHFFFMARPLPIQNMVRALLIWSLWALSIFDILSATTTTAFTPPLQYKYSSRHMCYNFHDYISKNKISLSESVGATNDNMENTEKTRPFTILVQTEIVPDRLDEFMQLIEINAINSRKEPECIRFDVIQSQEQNNLFFFYEIYTNDSTAIEHHKAQSHYQLWANFKASGGTLSSITHKAYGKFIT